MKLIIRIQCPNNKYFLGYATLLLLPQYKRDHPSQQSTRNCDCLQVSSIRISSLCAQYPVTIYFRATLLFSKLFNATSVRASTHILSKVSDLGKHTHKIHNLHWEHTHKNYIICTAYILPFKREYEAKFPQLCTGVGS